MQKLIKLLFKDKILYIAILCSVAIGVLSFAKLTLQPFKMENGDKLGHVIAYFAHTLFWLLYAVKNRVLKKALLFAISLSFFYGIVIEVLQGAITTYRTTSYYDVLANSVGILLASLIFATYQKNMLKKNWELENP